MQKLIPNKLKNNRSIAAQLAEQLYDGSITFRELISDYPESDDVDIIEL